MSGLFLAAVFGGLYAYAMAEFALSVGKKHLRSALSMGVAAMMIHMLIQISGDFLMTIAFCVGMTVSGAIAVALLKE